MRFKIPKNTDKFFWTNHAIGKMKQYRLSEQKVRGVIFRFVRKEEGVAPRTVAVMQRGGSKKNPYELWVMYQLIKKRGNKNNIPTDIQKKIISAWIYPGESPVRNAIPDHVIDAWLEMA